MASGAGARVKPYWQSDDGAITVYHARFEDVLAAGAVDVPRVALIHDDPPYGIRLATCGARVKRSRGANNKCASNDFPAVVGDDKPFDPAPLLVLKRPAVLWGANHYSDRVPGSPSWIFWDKREDVLVNNNADGELAWSNLGGPLRVFPYLWAGMMRAGERGETLHPTQKPIALCSYVYQRAKLKPGDLVFVPHGGSGPDLPACRAAGLRLAWVECERAYCDTAIARIGAVTPARAAEPAGPLFARPREEAQAAE